MQLLTIRYLMILCWYLLCCWVVELRPSMLHVHRYIACKYHKKYCSGLKLVWPSIFTWTPGFHFTHSLYNFAACAFFLILHVVCFSEILYCFNIDWILVYSMIMFEFQLLQYFFLATHVQLFSLKYLTVRFLFLDHSVLK